MSEGAGVAVTSVVGLPMYKCRKFGGNFTSVFFGTFLCI